MSGILNALVGSGGDRLRLDTASVSDATPGGPSTAQWRIDADGGVYISRSIVAGGAFQFQYNWVTPASNAVNYECTWTSDTGTVDTTPTAEGAYVACTADRTWAETNPTTSESASFIARIRRVGGSTDLVTATITLNVDGSP
jgi:hypothetical protein